MTALDTFVSFRIELPRPYNYAKSMPQNPRPLKFTQKPHSRANFLHRSFTVLCASSPSGDTSKPTGNKEDFVTRVLKENPSQVEPKFLIGEKFYTLKEKQNLSERSDPGIFQILAEKLNLREKSKKGSESQNVSGNVYLKDILREYRGKLYVPEQIFGAEFSEDEEFDKNVKELPKLSGEEFRKYMNSDKVKLLTSKESGYRDFVVDLKDIPGDKRLQRTQW